METITYSDYFHPKYVPSLIIDGKDVYDGDEGNCPRCYVPVDGFEHSEIRCCSNCGLWMQLFGNALHIAETKEELGFDSVFRQPNDLDRIAGKINDVYKAIVGDQNV